MPYVIPNFNILCNIWTGVVSAIPALAPAGPSRLFHVPCALVHGRRVNAQSTGGTGAQGYPVQGMSLLLSKGTDIRGPQQPGQVLDLVECPADTGRYYWVYFVDDIGKGYANEHREAGIIALAGTWTPPYA